MHIYIRTRNSMHQRIYMHCYIQACMCDTDTHTQDTLLSGKWYCARGKRISQKAKLLLETEFSTVTFLENTYN